MKTQIYLLSLGCPRNLVDSELLIARLKEKGFKVSSQLKNSKIAVVNTCAFIEDAKHESIDIILELAKLKKEGKLKHLIVTGCLSQRYPEELMKEICEIDGIFGTSTYIKIPDFIEWISSGRKIKLINRKSAFLYGKNYKRTLLTPRHFVYIKIQEGCMNRCSYCIIPNLRGQFRSRTIDSILNEVRWFKNKYNIKEINLIGQDITLYGVDIYKKYMLPNLLRLLTRIGKGIWIRLLYTHPAHYTDELIKVIKNENNICKYVDIPIQHINDRILKQMNRRVNKKSIIELIEKLRKEIPGLAIRTTVMVGFPGETEKEFKELVDFIRDMRFERLGVFEYSREEETKAYSFPHQIPEKEKKKRADFIMQLQMDISVENNKKFLGKRLKVLVEETTHSHEKERYYIARSQFDAPEVDGVVYVQSEPELKIGDFADVVIEDTYEYDLVGKVTKI